MDLEKIKDSRKRLKRSTSLHWVHWLIIALSLLLTFFAWYFSQRQVNEKRLLQFRREANQVVDIIQERMLNYEDALWAGVAMIQANGGKVSYARWKAYVENLNLLQKYPGINGLGVIHLVRPSELKRYLAEQRLTRPDYHIHPKHPQNLYLPITYIVPVAGNEKAVGLDMAHENNRFTAALKAEESGEAQITGPIILVQDQEKTPGFLFYAPYYQGGEYPTVVARQQHFLGMVYAPFIFKKLMRGVLSKTKRHVALKILDGDFVLYNEHLSEDQHFDPESDYQFEKKVPVYGRMWTFDVWGSHSFQDVITDAQPLTILVGGIIIDMLLLALFIVISRSNRRALSYADTVTEDLYNKTIKIEKSNKELRSTKLALEKMAHYDTITGLPNRDSFSQYLEKALGRAKRANTLLAVCFLDLDDFKQINDSMGHHSGDQLLSVLPKALLPELREVDYLARLSGDEFGLILEQIDSPLDVATILDRYLNVFDRSFHINNYEITTTVSIGVAVFPSAGNSVEALLRHADIAMYKAKDAGKNTFAFFNEDTDRQVRRQHRLELALKQAVKNAEFHLRYQPLIDATGDNIFGVEALLRWENPELGVISPAEFIPIAEECGVMDKIGEWVLERVAADYSLLKTLSERMTVCVNTSVRQFENSSFDKLLLNLLESYQIPSKALILEVTETGVMRHPDLIFEVMKRLDRLGVCFALDDFGTGYSSMAYLKRLPISYIKVDQGFVSDIETDPSDAAIVRAIIQLSHALGIETIAEGVETAAQYDFLKRHDCHYFQGYYFSQPMTLEQLLEKYSE